MYQNSSEKAIAGVGGLKWVCDDPPQEAEDETNCEREKDGYQKR
jgi:hypothetical protein